MSANCTKDFSITVAEEETVTLLSYWRLEEVGVSDVRVDSHGSNDWPAAGDVGGEPAKVGNGANWDINAGYFGSLALSGANSPLWTYADGFTICGWFRSTGIVNGDAGDFLRLVGNALDWQIQILKGAGSMNMLFVALAGGGQSTATAAGMNNSGFNFFRFWHDPADGLSRVKVNEGATQTAGVPTNPVVLQPCDTINADLVASQPFSQHWLDELGIWQGIMSDADGAYLYNSGTGRVYPDVPGV